MTTELSLKIAECVDLALTSPEGVYLWRGLIQDEEWKISADYNGVNETVIIRVKRRDQLIERGAE